MIQYALVCENEHGFEGWFRSAAAYEEQARQGTLECPICGSADIHKALMAPAVAASKEAELRSEEKTERVALSSGHPEQAKIREEIRKLRQKLTSEAEYVGDRFADEARKIHLQEAEARGIYGEATNEEVSSLLEDGIEFMPLPNLPEEHN
ncbi:DUF1178 family protein [Cucumibacter marinus]|uniref:DUF1178 family protein n=1 Tax=Cucumibacter marinus TaxID=1121252 RepID=UPI0003FA5B07|nr:DUF1178 family protein [Cucumibacter marinus]